MRGETLIISDSKWKLVLMVTIAILIAIAMFSAAISLLIKWPASDFFPAGLFFILIGILTSLMTIACVQRLIKKAPFIVLDEQGITLRDSPYEFIPWSEITSVSVFYQYRSHTPYIDLTLRTPEKWFVKLSKTGQKLKLLMNSRIARIDYSFATCSVNEAKIFIKNHIVKD